MTPGYLISSPLGDIALRVEDDFLTGLFFLGQKYFPKIPLAPIGNHAPPLALHAQQQITEYFSGARRVFTLPISLRGTSFQRQVWKALSVIPYGSLVSYSDVAKEVGLSADHARAVGNAVGRNPVSVIVPCHRVVGTSGGLTGYAGGIDRKAALLDLENQRDVRALSCQQSQYTLP
jgi:methylated-DNA-[protein]-cysteine S-methyltransferase